MMTTLQSYVRQSQRILRRLWVDPRFHVLAQTLFWALAGMVFSAASLGSSPMPVALGLVCALEGWPAVMAGLGGALGYLLFWGSPGVQGAAWMGAGLAVALLVGPRRVNRQTPLLMPAIASFLVSAMGVGFQIWLGDTTPIPIYLLRVGLAGGANWVFTRVKGRQDPAADWLAGALAVLALAQVWPVPYLGLGFVAAGIFSAMGTLPAVALAGLGLDLARVTVVPMTAVLCLLHLVRLLPRRPPWLHTAAIGLGYLMVMGLLDLWDLTPLPGLILGSALGTLLPAGTTASSRRGETGVAQVRLEMAAGALSQAEQLLLEAPEIPVDEAALIRRAAERACGGCPCRKVCRETQQAVSMPAALLHRPVLTPEDLPVRCRKGGRLLQEFHRSQEQLRQIRGSRDRQKECRRAVVQQYQFLSDYLRDLSDQLGQRGRDGQAAFVPRIAGATAGLEQTDGDRCVWFSGIGCRYYVLLCDGMGTGLGAAQESRDAAMMLRRLLSAGYPAEHALRSLNSLCALRGRAGAVTVDLAELRLDTGKATLYKWGAAPSYLMGRGIIEKIGTAGPPPGLSVTDGRETVDRLSLRRGETLILLSDGVDGEAVLRRALDRPDEPPGELAARVLEIGCGDGGDDASVIVIRLEPQTLST